MKEEVGTAEADAFNAPQNKQLIGALEAVKSAKEGVDNALLAAQGRTVAFPTDMDAAPGDMDRIPKHRRRSGR